MQIMSIAYSYVIKSVMFFENNALAGPFNMMLMAFRFLAFHLVTDFAQVFL